MKFSRALLITVISGACGGCGLSVSEIPEVWDRAEPFAAAHLEMQIKRAVFCELRKGALLARQLNSNRLLYDSKVVSTDEDIPFPDSWGAQVTLTLTADEKSSLTPGVTFRDPGQPSRVFGQTIAQSFSLGVGSNASSQNVRYDKFFAYYTSHDLIQGAGGDDICEKPPRTLGPPSSSSPFVEASGLGLARWLPGAIAVVDFQRSSRASETGIGPPLGTAGSFASDVATYSNKFTIITSGNVSPTWSLVRVSTPTTPLFDLNRTRTHELIVTVGPGATSFLKSKKTGRALVTNTGPSSSAVNSHFAAQIGSAVAAAIRGQ